MACPLILKHFSPKDFNSVLNLGLMRRLNLEGGAGYIRPLNIHFGDSGVPEQVLRDVLRG